MRAAMRAAPGSFRDRCDAAAAHVFGGRDRAGRPAALLLLVFLWPLSAGDGVFGATIIDHNVVVSATQ